MPTPEKLTQQAAFIGTIASGDLFHFVDISDTSQDPAGSSYALTAAQLFGYMQSNLTFPNIYNADGTLTANRTVNLDSKKINFTGGRFNIGIPHAAGASSIGILNVNGNDDGYTAVFYNDSSYTSAALTVHAYGVRIGNANVAVPINTFEVANGNTFITSGNTVSAAGATVHILGSAGVNPLRVDTNSMNNAFVVGNSGAISFGGSIGSNYFSIKDNLTPDSNRKVFSVTDSLGTEIYYQSRNNLFCSSPTVNFSSSGLHTVNYYYSTFQQIWNDSTYSNIAFKMESSGGKMRLTSPGWGQMHTDLYNIIGKDYGTVYGSNPGLGASAIGTWQIVTPNTTQVDAKFTIQRYDAAATPVTKFEINSLGEIFAFLPTTAGTSGSLWNDSGTVKVA